MVPKLSHTTQSGDPYKGDLLLTTQVIDIKKYAMPSMVIFSLTETVFKGLSATIQLPIVIEQHFSIRSLSPSTIFHLKLTFLFKEEKPI